MGLHHSPRVSTDGLVVYLDAANPKSYPGTGTTWYDISGRGNHATLTGSPTWNAGTMLFDGVDDQASIPFNATDFTFNLEQTIFIAMKPDNNGVRRNPYNQAYGGGGTWTLEPNATITWFYGTNGGNTTPYASTPSTTVPNGEYAIMSTTRMTLGSRKWFKNGTLTSSSGVVYDTVTTGTSPILIGNGYAGWFKGLINVVMVYNRALSDAEVASNTLAIRGRYGL